MYYLIYQITNKINGRIYIGKHKTKNKNDVYMGSGILILLDEKKYGIENFEKTILFECQSEEEMNQKEAEIVNEEFVNRKDTYNIALGGDGGWHHCNGLNHNNKNNHRRTGFLQYIDNGIYPSAEWLKNASEKEVQIFCQKISNGLKQYIKENGPIWKGKHHTEETKQKMHEIHQRNHHQQGKKNSQYGKHWWKDPNDKTKSMSIKEGDPVPKGWIKGRWQKQK